MVLLLLSARSSAATTYFVGGKGSDSATGLSRAAAFRTLQHAADVTQPGDTVYALNGTYSNATPEGPVLNITNPGTPEHWIT